MVCNTPHQFSNWAFKPEYLISNKNYENSRLLEQSAIIVCKYILREFNKGFKNNFSFH